ncbi:unnamed protein product [Rotaria socialis]|nr:unnamed protein product [Rotaria socialis]
MAETILELCRLVSTETELSALKSHESAISQLSVNNSIVELFEKVQFHSPPTMQEKIHAYLTLLRLSSHSALDVESQHILFDNLVTSWLTLFNITCVNSQQVFTVISSILTSFHGLIYTKDIPLAQQLYTTALTSALCRLANFRQHNRALNFVKPLTVPTSNLPSILITIRETLAKRTCDEKIPPLTVQQTAPKPILTRMTSIECPYSEATLTQMETSVLNYIKNVSRPPAIFLESDTIRHIVDTALNTRAHVNQWYATFTTLNVLVHYRSNPTDLQRIRAAHDIVQYGIQLLRDLIIARKVLEPTFARIGIQFLTKELMQLEKCLLSLALEKYPNMRHALRQLNIDVSRIKVDFKPPSASVAPKGRSSNKPRFEILSGITDMPEPTQQTSGLTSVTNTDDDTPLSFDDWENATGAQSDQQIEDALKLEKKRKEMKSKKMSKLTSNQGLRANVQNLASGMLNQNTNTMKAIPASGGAAQSDIIPMDASDNQEINIDLGMKAMQEHLQKQPNLIEMYEKINAKAASIVPDGKLDNRSLLKPSSQHERWTYQLVVEIPAINHMIDLIVKEFRSYWEKLDLAEEHQIHWCIMIDNSGSMSLHRNSIYEALVIIMELLRKLESKFAVARFGTRTNQKILKNLDDLFTNQDGQYVLEALTFDEGTYPATGLARIANKIFPVEETQRPSESIIHRLVLMITDGLTQERDDQSYSETINRNKINLGFMFIETADQSSSQVLLRRLKQAQSCILKANNISELPYKIPQLMHDMVKACLAKVSSSALPPATPYPVIQIKVPCVNSNILIEEILATKEKYTAINQTSYTISSPTTSIPRLTQIRSQLSTYLSQAHEYTDYGSRAMDALRQYYHSLKPTSMMQEIEKKWISYEYEFSGLVDDLSAVLGDIVFPFNKFTRRRAALRGSSLYLPGVIKAMTTEWTYKKIFSAKLAGGKRDHAICLVLDVSTSMFGTLSIGMIKTIVVFTAALRKLSLENFGIIVFGRDVRLIKTNEQPWDAACIYTLMQQLRFDRDDDTKDADALEAAIDLLIQCPTRGEKKIFILTDGYSNCGNRLSMIQQRAEDHNIDLIAMAIGTDQTNLKSTYKRYLQCAAPYGLPKALRSLFEQETQLFSLEWPQKTNEDEDIDNDENSDTPKKTLFDGIKSNKVFGEMIQDLAGEREKILINSGHPPSNITVDICFCLDCTGSMSRWLSAAKGQMKIIIEDITKLIEKEYPSLKLKLRFAIVGYRDISDRPQFFVQDFTDEATKIINFLNGLTASGGGDIPEDVLGALNQCLTLTWSNTNARFIVLITDAPGHGPELNENLTIDQHAQGVPTHTVSTICAGLLKKDAEIDLIFCRIKPNATAKMEKAFASYYDAQKDETGKQFTKIKLFDDEEQEAQSFHFVFVLDESGSMTGEWNALQSAYNAFLNRRNDDQGAGDYFTVVQFDSTARIICQQQQLANTPRLLSMKGGGTNYFQGLEIAKQAIANDQTKSSVVMIFMSDGGDGSGKDCVAIIRQLKQQYGVNHNFVCHTVGFGSGISQGSSAAQLLTNMAAASGGRTYSAQTGNDLKTVFNHIAANSTTSDALVERFSEILAREISVKIMVDYL